MRVIAKERERKKCDAKERERMWQDVRERERLCLRGTKKTKVKRKSVCFDVNFRI